MNLVATTSGKDVHITFRINPKVREEFKIAADLRGASMSGLIHQFIVKTIREEKASNPAAFIQGSSVGPDGPQPDQLYEAVAGMPKGAKKRGAKLGKKR